MSVTRTTRVRQKRHKCDTSDTRTTQVRHECLTNDKSATLVRNFDFDNDTNENTFSHPYITYMANERLQEEEQFHSKNYLLVASFPCQNAFKKCTTKTELCNGKSYIKKLHTRL